MTQTIAGAFEESAQRYADHDFLCMPPAAARVYGTVATTLTYRQAAERIAHLRAVYDSAGYGRGHRVALALDNRPEFFLHLIALNGLGASVVSLNAAMSRDELSYVLTHSDTAVVVAHDTHAVHLRGALPPDCGLAVGGNFALPPAMDRKRLAGEGEAALMYTSGTTGAPKGCILENEYFSVIGEHYPGIGGYCHFRPGLERLITPLPVSHMNALACSFMAMLTTGGCLVQLDRFHPSSWWNSCRESRATCFHYLGVMPAMLMAAPPDPQDPVGDHIRFGFGAGVDPRHHAPFEARFGVRLIESWAMTETGGGAWLTASEEPRHVGQRCFGRAPAGLEWRIVDEAGADTTPGVSGELLVRRAGCNPRRGFFSGYYKDLVATNEVWAGGWFHTGDSARIGSDGSFYFVDRLKNVIRRSGENIAAVEVESQLHQVPGVAACAVTAVADEMRGEEVLAFIVPKPGFTADRHLAEQIQHHCMRGLAYFKAPGYVAFIEQLPQTASQKLARGEIKRAASRAVEAGNVIDIRSTKKRAAAQRTADHG